MKWHNLNNLWKWIILSSTFAALVILVSCCDRQALVKASLTWVKSLGILAPIAYITLYNLATILLVPGSLMTLGGGILFGLVWGTIYGLIAAFTGALITFLIGRYVAYSWVQKRFCNTSKFKIINAAVASEGLKIVLLTRLCPVIPFNLLNYLFGISQVSLKDYSVGSLGIFPATFMYVYLGTIVGDLAMIDNSTIAMSGTVAVMHWGLRIVGFISTVALSIYLTKVARKSLKSLQ
jgi:uncharacterized membrane protein YdjX (TVP38/TMEM64 family)